MGTITDWCPTVFGFYGWRPWMGRNMAGFTKLFSTIVTSSIWSEDNATRVLWVTMLAMADSEGVIEASLPGLARSANLSMEECSAAVLKLESPDPYSRTPDLEGRRVVKVDGGWSLVNYKKYREKNHPIRASLDVDGYVYYVGIPNGDRVKIGFSKNPWSRLATLKTTEPSLEILATEKATMSCEKDRHSEFKNSRIDGEWFSLTPSLNSLIVALSGRDSRSKPTTTGSKKIATVAIEAEAEAEAEAEEEQENHSSGKPDKLTSEPVWSEEEAEFEKARKLYPSSAKRGHDTEWKHFKTKHKDWKDAVVDLVPAIQIQIRERTIQASRKEFVPPWKNFQTWINQRYWEQAYNAKV